MIRKDVFGLSCALFALAACASPLDKGEQLYRQGALPEAIQTWQLVPEDSEERARADLRIKDVRGELERMLRRFEKQAEFFESEQRLGEAVLYYRLALKMNPNRPKTLDRVQSLVRELRRAEARERKAMRRALKRRNLIKASEHAQRLRQLNPFDAGVQIEVRQAQTEIGNEVSRYVEAGRERQERGDTEAARQAFTEALRIDAENPEVLGYLANLNETRADNASALFKPISQDEILADGHFQSGQRSARKQEPYRALEEFESALHLNPNHNGAKLAAARLRRALRSQVPELYEAGKRYFQEDDLHNAVRSWGRVLLIQPSHARARENKQRAERILQRLEEIQSSGN